MNRNSKCRLIVLIFRLIQITSIKLRMHFFFYCIFRYRIHYCIIRDSLHLKGSRQENHDNKSKMAHQHSQYFHKISIERFVRSTKPITIVLIFLQIITELYSVTAMTPPNTSSKGDFGAFMERQPESTIAPLYDEVVFECALNLDPDRIEWRFHPQKTRNTNAKTYNDYIYLNKTVIVQFSLIRLAEKKNRRNEVFRDDLHLKAIQIY